VCHRGDEPASVGDNRGEQPVGESRQIATSIKLCFAVDRSAQSLQIAVQGRSPVIALTKLDQRHR